MASKRKQVYLAMAGSLGIHLVLLFAWALTVQWFPAAQAATTQSPDQLKLELVAATPEPALAPTPKPPLKLAFHDSADLPAASPPPDAAFQSDRDTEAASRQPPAGEQPLPSQTGRQVPHFEFDPHPEILGDPGQTAGQNVPENMPPAAPETAPPPPRPAPPAAATPAPSTPAPTPKEADPRDAALVAPPSIPSAPAEPEPNPYDPSFRPPVGMTEPPRPTPIPRRGGYQPLQAQTYAAGNISKSGADSVAAEASPIGRYVVAVKGAVSYRFRQYVAARPDLTNFGYARVRFIVNRAGKILTPHVISNTANEALASMSLRALAEAEIPAMPGEVAGAFPDGELTMDINFGLENGAESDPAHFFR